VAAVVTPMRTLQEWMGHRSIDTTEIYPDYAPDAGEKELVERASQVGEREEVQREATPSVPA
jgi:integrase